MKAMTRTLTTLAAVTLTVAGTAQASLIYSDSLTGSGAALNGTTVDFSSGTAGGTLGAAWIAADTYMQTATGTIGTDGGVQGAYLPFTPQTGYVYKLSATMEYLDTEPSNWAALGFRTGDAIVTGGAFHEVSGSDAYSWALVRAYGTPQFFGGPNATTTGGADFATPDQSGRQTLTITLDTRGDSWTSYATIGGYNSDTFIYETPPDIAYVSFGGTGSITNTTNFSLSEGIAAVPEPGSLLSLGGLVGSGLLLRNRRRK